MEKANAKKGIASRKEATAEPKNRPIESFREGDVSVSVWQREFKGRVFYSCSFERSYKDATGQWRYTKYFGLDDLGKVISLAKRAADYLDEKGQQEAEPLSE